MSYFYFKHFVRCIFSFSLNTSNYCGAKTRPDVVYSGWNIDIMWKADRAKRTNNNNNRKGWLRKVNYISNGFNQYWKWPDLLCKISHRNYVISSQMTQSDYRKLCCLWWGDSTKLKGRWRRRGTTEENMKSENNCREFFFVQFNKISNFSHVLVFYARTGFSGQCVTD